MKSNWTLSQESFDRMLRQLNPDREAAGAEYLRIREKLCKFFQWRNCATPDECADQTIDRVARRIDEGAEIRTADVYLFFHGVAVNVLREYWKAAEKVRETPLEDAKPDAGVERGEDPLEVKEKEGGKEQRLDCLDGCVRKLPPQHLMIITEYHQDEGGAKIARRNRLAEHLGIPLNALRVRVFRLRAELEKCVTDCTGRKAA